MRALLQNEPTELIGIRDGDTFSKQQLDDELLLIVMYLLEEMLSEDRKVATEITLQVTLYTVVDKILYFIGNKPDNAPRVMLPSKLWQDMIKDYHVGIMVGHFSGPKIFQEVSCQWWWKSTYLLIMSTMCHCSWS